MDNEKKQLTAQLLVEECFDEILKKKMETLTNIILTGFKTDESITTRMIIPNNRDGPLRKMIMNRLSKCSFRNEDIHEPMTKSKREKIANAQKSTGNSNNSFKMKTDDVNIKSYEVPTPNTNLSDVAGIEHIIDSLKMMFEVTLANPNGISKYVDNRLRGALLHGPPGSGKTLLAKSVAGEYSLSFFSVSSPELITGVSGGTENNIRNIFCEALEKAPSLIFFDDLETIAGHRESADKAMGKRIVSQLCSCIDSIPNDANVFIIGATSVPSAIDQTLRSSERLGLEFAMKVPDKQARKDIIQKRLENLEAHSTINIDEVAAMTPGYVGGDLRALCNTAGLIALERNCEIEEVREMETEIVDEMLQTSINAVTIDDYRQAFKQVQPTLLREGFIPQTNLTFDDIGALDDVKEQIYDSILLGIKSPELFARFNQNPSTGILLYGPPGCGKTLLARAIASQSGANFISVKGPELLDKFVGESERAVRDLFERAKTAQPCVIFFDELDALVPKRGNSNQSAVTSRVVNQFLTVMDGLESRGSVFIIGATNRPLLVDEALLRPGRMGTKIYVPMPSHNDRETILKTIMRDVPFQDVNFKLIANATEGFSGADLNNLVRRASLLTIKIAQNEDCFIEQAVFDQALKEVKPSVDAEALRKYSEMQRKLDQIK
eukprot:TRINITY_DN2645_c0_g2_i1.p1 TRINITY_DN2645_c0_g2~~TRINITY_DN2645_c0_g2_i1.p1  ORF type:complete len:665 (-),score=181.25 TRINITY_DN2645_c0_g2_i1:40-2034(-)